MQRLHIGSLLYLENDLGQVNNLKRCETANIVNMIFSPVCIGSCQCTSVLWVYTPRIYKHRDSSLLFSFKSDLEMTSSINEFYPRACIDIKNMCVFSSLPSI